MTPTRLITSIALAAACLLMTLNPANAQAPAAAPSVVVAEGELFKTLDKNGWKATPQEESLASHTYGGMWSSNGGLLGAPAASEGSVAESAVTIPAAGEYRVWSKYQSPPYFNYEHRIEVIQGGKTVFSGDYGKLASTRLWSFSAGNFPQIWWYWGVDHDAAESPKTFAHLAAGPAMIRVTTTKNAAPAGDRYIDFVVLTTNPNDSYTGYNPASSGIGSPFLLEAIAANHLYARFRNTSTAPAKVKATTPVGHLQPIYSGQTITFPDADVAPGEWSPWVNIAPKLLRLAHEEGTFFALMNGATAYTGTFDLQLARDAAGADLAGEVKVNTGDAVAIPIDVVWNKSSKVMTSREHAEKMMGDIQSKAWRTSNGGKKPQKIAYYGAFNGGEGAWVMKLKDALGYNTLMPGFPHLERDGYHQHTHSEGEITAFAKNLTPEQKKNMRILSFGDEISIGQIDFKSEANNTKFRAWLKAKNLTKDDVGVDPATATLSNEGDSRLAWWSTTFNQEEQFQNFANMTKLAENLFHKDVLTGANYSPHGMPQYYGPIYQWIDIFKVPGMKAFWAEDYVFSVPEQPQMISWMLATARAAVKYHNLTIHFYVMPHAPGQTAGNLRRSMIYAVGAGSTQIDNFWVAPAETFTENFVSWAFPEVFRVIHESIFDAGEVEDIAVGGKVRSGRVAVVLSKATDFNEARLKVDIAKDEIAKIAGGGTLANFGQTLDRKEAQMLYMALLHNQQKVELVTEDDITDGILKNFDVVYFAGEWIDNRASKKIAEWVNAGGTLCATAGLGALNQYNQPEPSLLALLGVKSVTNTKTSYCPRPFLELPLLPAIDTLTMADGKTKVKMVAMKSVIVPGDAKVIATWSDGSAAATEKTVGKGKAIAIGGLPGHSYLRSGLRTQPFARGGTRYIYNPDNYDAGATALATLGVADKAALRQVVTSEPLVESIIIDNTQGSLLTLTNWSNAPVKNLKVEAVLSFAPKSAKSVQSGKTLPVTYADGKATVTLDLAEADYVVFMK
jgi:hypothetical protein